MINRIISLAMCCIIILTLVPQISFAESETSENYFEWDGTSITKYIGSASNVIIPEKATSIGKNAFSNSTGLTSIIIPNRITSIGVGAFWNCCSLESVTLSTGLKTLEENTFRNCTNLKAIIIPDGITSIGKKAFESCSSLKSIDIPNSVTSIAPLSFSLCKELTSIKLSPNIKFIDAGLFKGCENLQSIILPKGITYIDGEVFADCTKLSSITIPDGVTNIESCAFEGCTSLLTVTIPDSVIYISSHVFNGCTSLSSIVFQGKLIDDTKHLLKDADVPESCSIIGNEQCAFTWAVDPIYMGMGNFNDGLVSVLLGEVTRDSAYIDATGNVVIDAQYKDAGSFQGGLAPVVVEFNDADRSQSKYGYIDTTGKIVLPAIYYFASEFEKMSDGNYYAWVNLTPSSESMAIINTKGEVVPNDSVSSISTDELYESFSEGLKIQAESNEPGALDNLNIKKGYIDTQGKTVIPPQWSYVTPFEEGMAIVGDGADPLYGDYGYPEFYGIIDTKGNYILPLQKKVKFWNTFHEGVLVASLDDMYGLIKLNKQSLITVTLDGKDIAFDQPPIIENGRTLVPLRAIFEAIGANLVWDASSQTITAKKGSTTITLSIGNKTAIKNGQTISLDVPAKLVGGRTLVPVRFIADSFGIDVQWDEVRQEVILISN